MGRPTGLVAGDQQSMDTYYYYILFAAFFYTFHDEREKRERNGDVLLDGEWAKRDKLFFFLFS